MKKGTRITGIVLLSLLAMYLAFAVISSEMPEQEDVRTIDVYFLDPVTNNLTAEKRALELYEEATDPVTGQVVTQRRQVEVNDYANEVLAAFDMLRSGPFSAGLAKVYPDAETLPVGLLVAHIENTDIRNVEVKFSGAYHDLPPAEEIVLRSAIVWTLTQLDWVNQVIIKVDEVELMRSDGVEVGPMNQSNVLINAYNPISQEKVVTKTVTLYFADENLTGLLAERRSIKVPSGLSEERVVVDELLAGPASEVLAPLIPSDTVINEVNTQNGVCYVDVSSSFDLSLMPGTAARELAVYSIVNTLTELSSGNVKTVQFYIDAEKPADKKADIDLSQTFQRNESYIIADYNSDFN